MGNLAILVGVLIAIVTVIYISPGTQENIRRKRKAREAEMERQFWEQRDINDKKQAEAQALVEAERRRKREEQQRLKAQQQQSGVSTEPPKGSA